MCLFFYPRDLVSSSISTTYFLWYMYIPFADCTSMSKKYFRTPRWICLRNYETQTPKWFLSLVICSRSFSTMIMSSTYTSIVMKQFFMGSNEQWVICFGLSESLAYHCHQTFLRPYNDLLCLQTLLSIFHLSPGRSCMYTSSSRSHHIEMHCWRQVDGDAILELWQMQEVYGQWPS